MNKSIEEIVNEVYMLGRGDMESGKSSYSALPKYVEKLQERDRETVKNMVGASNSILEKQSASWRFESDNGKNLRVFDLKERNKDI